MGAHPSAPSKIEINGSFTPLPDLIRADAEAWIGGQIAARFGKDLPYLFKILDVRRMLSIQAHPTKTRAEEGFCRENEQGIPFDAPQRVYKDANHKPEVMVALSEFWLLHGFRTREAIRAELERVEELRPLLSRFSDGDLPGLYRHIMEMPQPAVDEILLPLRRRLATRFAAGSLPKSSPDYWAAIAFRDFELPGGHCDRGIFSIYLLNLVHVLPGQGIYQAAGIPHAYLEGQNVELMANSDNVFRGGLTPKYIAVQELINNLVFEPAIPQVICGIERSEQETVYPTPAPDFELFEMHIEAGAYMAGATGQGPEIWILLQGEMMAGGGNFFRRGDAAFVPPGTAWRLEGIADARLFGARVPVKGANG